MSLREKILGEIPSVNMIPPTVTEIIEKLSESDFEVCDIGKMINYDPSLTANILKRVNSSYYGRMDKVKSIDEAIVIMGKNELYRMVMLAALDMVSETPVEGYELPAGELWKRSVATACAAKILAEIKKFAYPNTFFTAGLLLDVGKIVLGKFVKERINEILENAERKKISFLEAEREILGIDHAELTAFLLASWKFPKVFTEAALYHHSPEKYKSGPNTDCVYVCHVADAAVMKSGIGNGREGLDYRISPKVLSYLKMGEKNMESLIADMFAELKAIEMQMQSLKKEGEVK